MQIQMNRTKQTGLKVKHKGSYKSLPNIKLNIYKHENQTKSNISKKKKKEKIENHTTQNQ